MVMGCERWRPAVLIGGDYSFKLNSFDDLLTFFLPS